MFDKLAAAVSDLISGLTHLEATLERLYAQLDFFKRFQSTANAWLIDPAEKSWSMVTSTKSLAGAGDFTSDATIGDWEPLARWLALTALTVVVMWAFYRVMFAHGSFTQYTARIMLPRFFIAAGFIWFSRSLIQGAVNFENDLTETIVRHAETKAHVVPMFAEWLREVGNEEIGLGPAVGVALLIGFALLSLVYYVRYALLVVLTILAPVAALLMVLPETKKYAEEWASLFITTLLMQPLQVFLLAIGFDLEAHGNSPIRHAFALAALWMCFKVPGALRMASTVGSHAESVVHKQAAQVMKVAGKLARVAAV